MLIIIFINVKNIQMNITKLVVDNVYSSINYLKYNKRLYIYIVYLL